MEAQTEDLKKYALGDVEEEIKSTRRVLESVPEESFGWKPHEKSWSLGELAAHVANLPTWQMTILSEDEFDLGNVPPPVGPPPGKEELLATFDRNSAAMLDSFEQRDDYGLTREWTLRRGEQVLFRKPRIHAFRQMGISHMIHHRAQLTVYLRLLDVPVPATYGPTAG